MFKELSDIATTKYLQVLCIYLHEPIFSMLTAMKSSALSSKIYGDTHELKEVPLSLLREAFQIRHV